MLEAFKLSAHVDTVASSFRILLAYDPRLKYEDAKIVVFKPSSLPPFRKNIVLHAHPIIDETTYAVVMHEIGHVVAPNGLCTHPRPKPGCHPREKFAYLAAKLVAEEAAWDWAKHLITQTFPWTAAMESVKQYGLGTYQEARRGYR